MSLFFEVLFQMFSGVKVMLLVLSILDGFHGLQLLDLSNSTRISDDNSFKFPPVGICLSLRNHWVMGLLHSKAVLFSSNWSKILYGTLSNFVHLYFVKVFCLFFFTGTVLFRHDSEITFSPEEILGMILNHSRNIAEKFAGEL